MSIKAIGQRTAYGRPLANFTLKTRRSCAKWALTRILDGRVIELGYDPEEGYAFAIYAGYALVVVLATPLKIGEAREIVSRLWLRRLVNPEFREAMNVLALDRSSATVRLARVTEKVGEPPKFTLSASHFSLSWLDFFPTESQPIVAKKTVEVDIDGGDVVVHSTSVGFSSNLSHTYRFPLRSISWTVFRSTERYGSFPTLVRHSHEVWDGEDLVHGRAIEQWDANANSKSVRYDGRAKHMRCARCDGSYVGYEGDRYCALCESR